MNSALIYRGDIELKIGGSFSASHSGDGTGYANYEVGLKNYYIKTADGPFGGDLFDGITMGAVGNELDNELTYALVIPELGISEGNTVGYAGSIDLLLQLGDVVITLLPSGVFRVNIADVNFRVDGVSVFTDGPYQLDSWGLSPGYIPLFGLPFKLFGSAGASADGINVLDNYEYTVTTSGTYGGGIRFSIDGVWHEWPVVFTTPEVPACWAECPQCLGVSGIVSGSTTWDIEVSVSSQIHNYQRNYSGNFYTRADTATTSGYVYIVPNHPNGVEKPTGTDYKALIYRGGLPEVKYFSSRTCGDTLAPVPGDPPDTVNQEGVVHTSEGYILEAVDSTESGIEEVLAEDVYCPVSISRSWTQSNWVNAGPIPDDEVPPGEDPPPPIDDFGAPPDPNIGYTESVSYEFPTTQTRSANTDMIGYLDWDGVIADPAELEDILLYWVYRCHKPWSYAYYFEEWWNLGFDEKWGLIGQQHIDNSALPSEQNTQTLTTLLSAPLLEGHDTFIASVAFPPFRTAWWGICRFRYDEADPPASVQLTSDSEPLWSAEDDIVLSFEASYIEVDNQGTNDWNLYLDLGSFTVHPYMYPHICDRIRQTLPSGSNVDGFRIYLEGYDGSEVLILEDSQDIESIPYGESTKYAGSWYEDYAGDQGSDSLAEGVSDEIIPSNERSYAFGLLPGRTGIRLRIEITPTDPDLNVKIDYPEFFKAASFNLVHESRRNAVLYSANGPGLRFGQWAFWLLAFTNPPIVKDPIFQMTALDWACTKRVVFEAKDAEDDLDTELTTVYDSEELSIREDATLDTLSFLWGDGAIVQNAWNCPPLAYFPNLNPLDSEDGYGMKVHSWAVEPRRYVTARKALHLQTSGDRWTTESDLSVSGWKVTEHNHEVDGTEGAFDVFVGDQNIASAYPYYGYFCVHGFGGEGRFSVHITQTPMGWLHSALSGLEGLTHDVYNFHQELVHQGTVAEGISFVNIGYHPSGHLVTVYQQDTTIYRTESYSWSELWSDPVSLGTGYFPTVAIDQFTGTEYYAKFNGTEWVCLRKLPDEDIEEVGTILSADSAEGAGLTVVNADSLWRLVFVCSDEDGVITRRYSTDFGETWNA